MKIGIVGAGWYGSHLALVLKKAGHEVTIFERNDQIFKGISGDRGVRLHAGPHYPRSEETRKGCHINFQRFLLTYPELVNQHRYSVYGLGDLDANFEPSKIDQSRFDAVCQETYGEKIDPDKWGYQHLISAFNLEEPSIVGGERLRVAFTTYLEKAGVKVVCNFNVTKLEETANGVCITNGTQSELFDSVINSTCFENLLPTKSLPYNIEVVYQPCLALIYKDKTETISQPPFSFIVMDGLYPCMMPYNDRYNRIEKDEQGNSYRIYMVTHGKWTIMGSCKTFGESQGILNQLTDEFVLQQVKPKCEAEMIKFWPAFKERFEYLTWTGSTLAKAKTEKEFRGAFTFAEAYRPLIHVFPGKVGCIFNVADEVIKLINNEKENIIIAGDYKFVRDGVLHGALGEITEKPHPQDGRNTCQLQTYTDLIKGRTGETPDDRNIMASIPGLQNIIQQNNHPLWSPPTESLQKGFVPVTPTQHQSTVFQG